MIPIYRAKSKENKTSYVEGLLISVLKEVGLCVIRTNKNYLSGEICCLATLSIHFPDMIDSQGNEIFASLQEDGKGGDICYVRDFLYGDLQGVTRYEDNHFRIHRKGKAMGISLKCRDIKVIGIQE